MSLPIITLTHFLRIHHVLFIIGRQSAIIGVNWMTEDPFKSQHETIFQSTFGVIEFNDIRLDSPGSLLFARKLPLSCSRIEKITANNMLSTPPVAKLISAALFGTSSFSEPLLQSIVWKDGNATIQSKLNTYTWTEPTLFYSSTNPSLYSSRNSQVCRANYEYCCMYGHTDLIIIYCQWLQSSGYITPTSRTISNTFFETSPNMFCSSWFAEEQKINLNSSLSTELDK